MQPQHHQIEMTTAPRIPARHSRINR